jgi:hypothetical protein
MNRASSAALVVLLALTSSVAAKDPASPEIIDVDSDGSLVAPPRVAVGTDGRILVALPVADGIDVARQGVEGRPVHAVRRADLIVGGRRGPRIAATGKAVVLAAITRREKKAAGGELLAWRSPDGGATWGDAVRVNDVPGCAEEGLFDLAALPDGRFAVVWLDDRTGKGKRLRADFSADGAAWGDDVLAYESPDGSICECCAPAIAAAGGGAVVAFRNSLRGDRDIWTMRLDAGKTKFGPAAKSGTGSWKLAACPMAGPAVGVSGADVVSAWRRERDVFLAVGGAEERDLGEGTEPQLVVGDDGVHAFWIANDSSLVHLAPGARAPAEIAKAASFPCAADHGSADRGSVVVWLDTATRRALLAILR